MNKNTIPLGSLSHEELTSLIVDAREELLRRKREQSTAEALARVEAALGNGTLVDAIEKCITGWWDQDFIDLVESYVKERLPQHFHGRFEVALLNAGSLSLSHDDLVNDRLTDLEKVEYSVALEELSSKLEEIIGHAQK